MLPFEGSSEANLFKHLSNHVFPKRYYPKYISYVDYVFLENVQNLSNSQKWKKHCKKGFCFSDNSMWIGSVKLSLLRREHLSLEVNVFTNSIKIFDIPKRVFFQVNCLLSDQ